LGTIDRTFKTRRIVKKFLQFSSILLGLIFAGGALAQPVVSYNAGTNAYNLPIGTAIATQTPTVTGTPVGTFANFTNWAPTINTGVQSGGLFYDATIGALYGAEYTYGELDKITLAAAVSSLNNTVAGNTGYCIVTDATGTVYYNYGTAVWAFATGTYGTYTTRITGFTAVKGIAVDASNNFYVVDAGSGANAAGILYKFAKGANGTKAATATSTLTGLNNPSGIAISGTNIFLAEYGTTVGLQGIFEIAGGTTTLAAPTSFVPETTVNRVPFNAPRNLTFDASGNLYVADYINAKIERITPAGTLTYLTTLTNVTNPNQITFDPTGNMYCGDLSGYFKKSVGTYFSFTGTLPPGLAFNTFTGAITGTPTTIGTYSIVVTAASTSGPNSPLTTVTFNCGAPVLSYAGTPYSYTAGVSNTTATITNTGGAVTGAYTFTITSGALPAGITFNTANGTFTCIPTAAGTVTGNVTATNAGGTGSAAITITVTNPPAPVLSYAGTPYSYTANVSNTTATISNTGGAVIGAYTLTITTGALPAGITFNTANGTFTVIPTAAGAFTGTVAGSNPGGPSSAAISITVTGTPPPTISYSPTNSTFTTGIAITPLTPTVTNAPTGYALTGTLPTGLSFSTSTGVISGTATAVQASTPYTVIASNSGGPGTSNTFFITVVNPPVFAYASPQTYTAGTAIATLSPTITSDGPLSGATISPVLPAGISMDASGNITGTPTAVTAATTYTITATGADGGIGTTTVSITVYPVAPTISYTGSPYTYTVGTAIATLTPTVTGAPTSYALTGTLPAGLSFSTVNGQISGTPTAAATVATFTISAYNANPTPGTTMITITVYPKAPTVAYTGSPYTFYLGAAITSQTPTITKGPTSFTISPNLNTNTGLTFDGATGIISGTPTIAATAVTYTISAYNANPTAGTTTVSITIDGPPTVAYTGSPYTYTVGTAITSLTPATTNNPTSYTISPNLTTNTGLAFSATTGVVSGTPTTSTTAIIYTITATNPAGNGTTMITITVNPKAPTVAYTGSPYTFGVGVTIPTETPATTNSPTSFAITPNLTTNTGLTFNTMTGVISGTPTTASASVTYTITASNANPTAGTTTIKIIVIAKAILTYNTPNTYPVGTAIAALSPTNTGGAVSATNTYSTAGTVILSTANGLNKPTGLAVDPSGNVYVANSVGNTITEYTTGGAVNTFPLATGATAYGLVFDSFGDAYVLESGLNSVVEYSGGMTGTPSTIITGLNTPTGIAIDGSGNLYIANSGNNSIAKYASTGGSAIFSTTDPAGYSVSGGIAVDASGNIYTADDNGGSYVDLFNSAGVLQGVYRVGSNNQAIYIDGANNILLTSIGTGSGSVYGANFGSTTVTETGFTRPEGIVSDGQGDIFISDYTAGTVTEFKPTSGYFLNGILPPGLTFSTTTGKITGTPTAAYTGTYTVTGYNAAGAATSNTFVIICGSAPVFTYPTPDSYNVGTAVTLSPTVTAGTGTITYAAPSLPAGLTINTSTGVISGTPTTASSANSYVVTATDPYGSGTFTISISIYAPPIITYTPSTNVYVVNNAIAPLVPANTGGPLTPISYGTGTLFATVAKPWGITSDSNGDIYVTSYSGKTITEYSPAGAVLGTYTTTAAVTGVAVSSPGVVYALLSNGRIYKYTAYGAGTLFNSTIYTNTGAAAGSGEGITIDAAGNLYVSDYYDGDIWKYTATTATMARLVTFGATGIFDPTGIAVDGAGNVYIVDEETLQISKYNSAGIYQSAVVTGLSNPYALYIDANGNFVVGDSGTGTVNEYNSSGMLLTSVASSPNPRGITEDATGDVYVSDYTNGTVYKYPPVYYTLTGGTLPAGLSFSSVTGTFSGTPTVAFPATTFTVTAEGLSGVPVTTTVTISCVIDYDWIGTTSSDWNTPGNWKSGTVPGATNTANIGVNFAFNNQPTVSITGSATATVAALQIGNSGGKSVILTVNTGYNLVVTGDITQQSDANATLGYTTTFAGGGVIQATNLNVNASTAAASAYTETVSSSAGSLQLSGNIALTSTNAGNAANAVFNLTGGITTLTATGLLTTNNAASSTSTFNITSGTLQVSAPAFLSGLSASGTNVVTLGANSVIGYMGAGQTVYTDAAITNLSGGAGLSYGGIAFSGTGIMAPTSGNLNVAGNFTDTMANDAGDYVSLATTPVFFNGTSTQSLIGGAGNGTIFATVTFTGAGAKTMTSGLFYVTSAGTLTMANSATLVAGGFLTLNSDATGSASVAQIPAGCAVNGTVNVQRYVSAERGYRLLSSPVYAGTSGANNIYSMNYLLNKLYLTGSGSGFTATGNPTLYLYDEGFVPQYTTFYNSNFIAISSMTGGTPTDPTYTVNTNGAGLTGPYSVPVGNGFYCFYRGNLSEGSNITNPSYTALADTLTASGTLNQGQVVFADWYTPTSTNLGGISQNYNLIGNPYASAIDLGTMSGVSTTSGIYITPYNGATGISKFIYELNPVSGAYGVYALDGSETTNGAGQYIASGQGFMVLSYGTPSQLIFNESAKASGTNANAVGEMARRVANLVPVISNPQLRLKLSADNIHTEETILSFNPGASSKYVYNEDAPHKTGQGIVGISSTSSDNVKMAINTQPILSNMTIPLNVNATVSGLYNINLSQDVQLPSIYEVWLKDAHEKDSLDIKDNPVYNFDINISDTTTFGSNRFSLVIRENPALMVHLLSFDATKAIVGVNVLWTTENEQNYTNFTVERSTDGGKTFADLAGFVSSAVGSYTYPDRNPVIGSNMYRLKITDLTGAITYSSVVTIMYANTGNTIALNGQMLVYPNPTAGMVNLSIEQTTNTNVIVAASPSYKIEIVNNLGIIVRNAVSATPTWSSDVTSLLPGTYFINVVNASNNAMVGKSAFVKL
jgi:sugar lactone lactonase YvrE